MARFAMRVPWNPCHILLHDLTCLGLKSSAQRECVTAMERCHIHPFERNVTMERNILNLYHLFEFWIPNVCCSSVFQGFPIRQHDVSSHLIFWVWHVILDYVLVHHEHHTVMKIGWSRGFLYHQEMWEHLLYFSWNRKSKPLMVL